MRKAASLNTSHHPIHPFTRLHRVQIAESGLICLFDIPGTSDYNDIGCILMRKGGDMPIFLRIVGLFIVIFGVSGGIFLITGKYGGNAGIYGFSVIIASVIIGVLYYVLGYFTKLSRSTNNRLMDIYDLLDEKIESISNKIDIYTQLKKAKEKEIKFAPEQGLEPIKEKKRVKEEVVGIEKEPRIAKKVSRIRKEVGLCANCWLSGDCEREKKARKRKEIITSCPGYLLKDEISKT